MKGTLYLIPSAMGENVPLEIYNAQTRLLISRIDHFIVERIKSARRFIRFIDKEKDINACSFFEIDKHKQISDESGFLDPLQKGLDMILMSEAGSPAIADPGNHIVKMAHEREIRVVPVPGPSSIYLALMASGLNGQHFQFHGYLPKNQNDRKKALVEIDSKVKRDKSAEIFMETPYRSQHLFNDILNHCNDSTYLCLAENITLPGEKIRTKKISEWKKSNKSLNKQLCIFILG